MRSRLNSQQDVFLRAITPWGVPDRKRKYDHGRCFLRLATSSLYSNYLGASNMDVKVVSCHGLRCLGRLSQSSSLTVRCIKGIKTSSWLWTQAARLVANSSATIAPSRNLHDTWGQNHRQIHIYNNPCFFLNFQLIYMTLFPSSIAVFLSIFQHSCSGWWQSMRYQILVLQR